MVNRSYGANIWPLSANINQPSSDFIDILLKKQILCCFPSKLKSKALTSSQSHSSASIHSGVKGKDHCWKWSNSYFTVRWTSTKWHFAACCLLLAATEFCYPPFSGLQFLQHHSVSIKNGWRQAVDHDDHNKWWSSWTRHHTLCHATDYSANMFCFNVIWCWKQGDDFGFSWLLRVAWQLWSQMQKATRMLDWIVQWPSGKWPGMLLVQAANGAAGVAGQCARTSCWDRLVGWKERWCVLCVVWVVVALVRKSSGRRKRQSLRKEQCRWEMSELEAAGNGNERVVLCVQFQKQPGC